MENRLTDQNYWENYYEKASTSKKTIERICSQYDPIWDLWISKSNKNPNNLIEIGAYPGRYIAYLKNKYNIDITGLDFNSDKEKVKETMEIMGVENYTYLQADFFDYSPEKKYDLVYSNGFIEHFDDFNKAMDLHLNYLNEDGSLFIMIPNLNYLRRYYGLFFDKENLNIHNLNCMHLDVFKKFAQRNNLEIKYLNYHGGFAYRYHSKISNKLKLHLAALIIKIFKKINPLLEKHPSKYYSSNIIAIFTKK
ncbi:MAG: methyltransferase domain-containing protein [Bacteroidota bacterium]